MTGMFAVFRREMLAFWVTPLAWILSCIFLLLQGFSFFVVVRHVSNSTDLGVDSGPVQAYFGQSIFLIISLLLLCPALTMRLFAEERRSGTLESLLTAPVSPAAVVVGKLLAVTATYGLMWAPTVLYLLILRNTGTVAWPIVGASYLGVALVGTGYLSVGLLMSAMTRSQLVAFMLSVGVEFGLFVFGIGEYVFDSGPLLAVSSYVSVFTQMDELSHGIIDSRRLVFDATLILLPLFVTIRVVDSWRSG